MRLRTFVPIFMIFAIVASGCAVADTGAFERVQKDVEDLRRDLERFQRVQKAQVEATAAISPTVEGHVTDVRSRTADLGNEVARLRTEVLGLNSRVEDVRSDLVRDSSGLNTKADELRQSIIELRAKALRIEEAEKRLAQMEERTARIETAMTAKNADAEMNASAIPEFKTPEDMYDYAIGVLKAGESAKARTLFSSFAEKNPQHKLMPNVLYWKGETFYLDKDFESSIVTFQDVIDKYPQSEKAPDAMLKQGLAFLSLKDTKNAKILFELVVGKFPKSPTAEKAKQKLAEFAAP